MILFLFLLKTKIVGEAVLTSTHNLCFGAKIGKNAYPSKPQFYYIKVGCKGVFVTRTCFRDVHEGIKQPSSKSPSCCSALRPKDVLLEYLSSVKLFENSWRILFYPSVRSVHVLVVDLVIVDSDFLEQIFVFVWFV